MKKTLLTTILAAMALVGCTKSELVEPPVQGEQDAIVFGSYLGDNAQTRASVITTETLGVDGFGVNAYYTGQKSMEEFITANTSDAGVFTAPEASKFMQNTKITYNEDKKVWEYSPLKYWPNNTDDKVSFFAYGPHAKGGEENGIVLNGTDITFTVNSEVKEQVDLIYHNQATNPTINKTKPAVGSKVEFKFDHALSRIAFTVEAAVDEVENGNKLLDGNTRINVKKVALVSDTYDESILTGPFYQSGTLNLQNGKWDALSEDKLGFVFDGGEVNGDGSDNEFYHTVVDKCAETGDDVNVVQLTRYNASEPQSLLNDESYLMIIPQNNVSFSIYIEYDVISEGYDNDTAVDYDGSAITKMIEPETGFSFKQGSAYNFNLVLGMTSVKFEVDEVAEWDETTPDEEVWLPENDGGPAHLLNKSYNKDNRAFEIETVEDLQALSEVVNSGAKYTFNADGNPVEYVETRSATRSGENTEVETYFYADASYLQIANIDLTEVEWVPIGVKNGDIEESEEEEYSEFPFNGTYDAQGKYSITYKLQDSDKSGIFNVVGTAEIIGLTVNGTITNSQANYTGGIVGESLYEGTTISNCHFLGRIDSNGEIFSIGGIIGNMVYSGEIAGCSNGALLTAGADVSVVGGIAGNIASESFVYACYNYGNISSTDASTAGAGIIGQLDGNYIKCIANYNTGTITGTGNIGNIVSYIGAMNTIENNCYAYIEGSDNNVAYPEEDIVAVNYPIGDGSLVWDSADVTYTALNIMNNALAAEENCGWKYVPGDSDIVLKVENEAATKTDILAIEITDKGNAKKGDLVLKDGSILRAYGFTTLTDDQKTNCRGIVFWTTKETTEAEDYETRAVKTSLDKDKILGLEYPSCNNGLIVALNDLTYNETSTMKWQNKNEQVWSKFQNDTTLFTDENRELYECIGSGYNDNVAGLCPQDFIYGFQNTNVLKAYNKYCKENSKADYIVLPVEALDGTEDIEDASSWYIPSMKELHILCHKDVDFIKQYDVYTKKIVDSQLELVGGTKLQDANYWSSTEQIGGNSDRVDALNFNDCYPYGQSKSSSYYVRAVCAF